MRKVGSFEYKQDAEDIILDYVTVNPQTTHAITMQVKENYFREIHQDTVKRLLENLKNRGKIKCFAVGRSIVWQR